MPFKIISMDLHQALFIHNCNTWIIQSAKFPFESTQDLNAFWEQVYFCYIIHKFQTHKSFLTRKPLPETKKNEVHLTAQSYQGLWWRSWQSTVISPFTVIKHVLLLCIVQPLVQMARSFVCIPVAPGCHTGAGNVGWFTDGRRRNRARSWPQCLELTPTLQ